MKIKYRFIPQHKDGHFIDLYSQPVDDYMKAVHFAREDDLESFLLGRYGPDDPWNFRAVPVKVTYELEENQSEHLSEAN
ncbi:hypothetical protein [Paenibacillus lactis]|uniref:hypothetical protein n=1 Tax=Paenibacillus lactis TaxID=228574 RepID=UPI00367D62CE